MVRHAKSSWENDWDDIDRPLKNRGVRNAYEMADRMNKRGLHPELMISSPATRAFHTAVIIARMTDHPLSTLKLEPSLYLAGSREILRVIRDLPDDFNSVMLFGHNPGWTVFANEFTGEQIDNIPTAGFLQIRIQSDTWKEADRGDLLLFDYPKKEFTH